MVYKGVFLHACRDKTVARLCAPSPTEHKCRRERADLSGYAHPEGSRWRPPSTTGKPPVKEQVVHFVNKRMPGGLPKRTARTLLDSRLHRR
jgi:hypothetical protein